MGEVPKDWKRANKLPVCKKNPQPNQKTTQGIIGQLAWFQYLEVNGDYKEVSLISGGGKADWVA